MGKLEKEISLLEEEFEKLEEEHKESCLAAFKKAAKKIFETHSDVNEFNWTQNAEWNDEETSFSVNSYGEINGEYCEDFAEENEEAFEDIEALISSVPYSIMELMFGTNAKVTVDRDKIQVEDY